MAPTANADSYDLNHTKLSEQNPAYFTRLAFHYEKQKVKNIFSANNGMKVTSRKTLCGRPFLLKRNNYLAFWNAFKEIFLMF